MFDNWTQSQMAFIDTMIITAFKEYVHKEVPYLNICRLSQNLAIERDADMLQANVTSIWIFLLRKLKIISGHCGYNNYMAKECHRRIVEEYLVKQVYKNQMPKRAGSDGSRR